MPDAANDFVYAASLQEVLAVIEEHGLRFPITVRPSCGLGNISRDRHVAHSKNELSRIVGDALHESPIGQVGVREWPCDPDNR